MGIKELSLKMVFKSALVVGAAQLFVYSAVGFLNFADMHDKYEGILWLFGHYGLQVFLFGTLLEWLVCRIKRGSAKDADESIDT